MKKQILIIAICLLSLTTTAQVWSNVGAGLNGTVNCLYNDTVSNRLYATGAFTGKIAYWNGTVWNVVPGFPGTYDGLTVITHGGNLFVGSDSIYMYNGSVWSTIPGYGMNSISPINSFGYGVKESCSYPPSIQNGFNDYLFFAGYFNDGQSKIIRLDPSNNYLPTVVAMCGAQQIMDMNVYNGSMFVTGAFSSFTWPSLVSSRNVIRYTTSLISVVTTFTSATQISNAKNYAGDQYFSGIFQGYNGVTSAQFIKYNTGFVATGGATFAGVMEPYSGNLYEVRNSAPGMMIWNGTTFTNIPSPIGQMVYCLAVYNGELFAGGTFTTPYSNIAKYNANPTLVLNASSSSVSCFGGNNGSATCTPTGGLPGFTYTWTPGNYTTSVVSGLTAGTYTVKVKDASTMTKTITVVVTQPTSVTATQTQSNVFCFGGSNASATVVASGGTPGYTYSWTPSGGTNPIATGLTQGAFSCIIKDANNCTITKNFNITQPTLLSSTSTQTNETGPSTNDGIAIVNPTGGTPSYTYSWSPSGGSSQTASGLTGGTYTCLITDSKGCTTSQTVAITTGTITGINSYTLPVGISIYPNPSNGQFTVDAGDAMVDVMNSVGQNVLHLTVDSKVLINIETPGVYFIQVNKNGKVFNSCLINQ